MRPGSYGIGIIGIKQRVQDHGGQFVLRSANPGTMVEVTIPIKSARSHPSQPVTAYTSNA